MVSDGTTLHRWKRAQTAELNFWRIIKKNWLPEDGRQVWQEKLAHGFNLDYSYFAGKSVLEVGCGPNGIIFQLENAIRRIGIEPMDVNEFVQKDWKKKVIIKGIGEKIAFKNNLFDVVVSFNSLDHCLNPDKVVREIYDVLRPGGDFLLQLHILRGQFHFLECILDKLDPPHPFHLTHIQTLKLVEDNLFYIKLCKRDRGTGLRNNTLKKKIGNYMMDTLWCWLVKKN